MELREGERVAGEGDLGVTLLADIEQVGSAEVRVRPGGAVPPLHAHARHAEALFVLAGELAVRLENGERRVGPDTWVFVPPEVVHAIAATGDEPARFLDLHAPGLGFGDFVRGLSSSFDQHPIPEYASADPGLVVVRRAGGGEGETIPGRPPERRATVLVDAEELVVSEFAFGPGQPGAELHVHHHHADAFLVVEGELVFRYREGSFGLPAGALVVVPPGVVHGFDNGDAPTRCFNLHLPGSGFADYLRGRNPGFDQHDPPPDGGADPAAMVVVRLSQ